MTAGSAWSYHNPTRVVFGPGVVEEARPRRRRSRAARHLTRRSGRARLAGRVTALIVSGAFVFTTGSSRTRRSTGSTTRSTSCARRRPRHGRRRSAAAARIDTAKVAQPWPRGRRASRRPRARRGRGARRRRPVPLDRGPNHGRDRKRGDAVRHGLEPRPSRASFRSGRRVPSRRWRSSTPSSRSCSTGSRRSRPGSTPSCSASRRSANRNATPVTSALAERGLSSSPGRAPGPEARPACARGSGGDGRGRAALGPGDQPDAHRAGALDVVSDHRAPRRSARTRVCARAAGSARVQPRGGRRAARARSRTGSGSPRPRRCSDASLELYQRARGRRGGPALRPRRSPRSRQLATEMLDAGAGRQQPARAVQEDVRGHPRAHGRAARSSRRRREQASGSCVSGGAVKEFERLDPSLRRARLLLRGCSGDWPHIGPVVESLLRRSRPRRCRT